MVLSKSAALAVLAVASLSSESEGRPLRWVADQLGASPDTLHKVLQRLVKVGILRSSRGPGGGFRLARDAEAISLLALVEAVDGPLRDRPSPVAESGGPGAAVRVVDRTHRALTDSARRLLEEVSVQQVARGEFLADR